MARLRNKPLAVVLTSADGTKPTSTVLDLDGYGQIMAVKSIPYGIQKISEGDEIYIITNAFSPGNLTLTNDETWGAARVFIRDVSVNTFSTNYNVSICQNNVFDAFSPTTREILSNGFGNTVVPVNMLNISSTSSLYVKYTDNSGSATAKFFITGIEK